MDCYNWCYSVYLTGVRMAVKTCVGVQLAVVDT